MGRGVPGAITIQFADILIFINRLVHQDGSLPDITMMSLTAGNEKKEAKNVEEHGDKSTEESSEEGRDGEDEKEKDKEKEEEEEDDDDSEVEETTGRL